jgi:nucleotide-binding universal stress UspA family protein
MKTILVATDFSATSIHAAKFAYLFAEQIKADIILCNATIERAIVPEAGNADNEKKVDSFVEGNLIQLKSIKKQIEHYGKNTDFKPIVRCTMEAGPVTDVVNKTIANEQVDLVVIGTHGTGGTGTFLLGNDSRIMVDEMKKPLMLVPPAAQIGPIKRIAFATDFKHKDNDLESIYQLIPWAKLLNAKILLTHVHEDEDHSVEFQERMKEFIIEIEKKAAYHNLDFRAFRSAGAESGLLWLAQHGQIDVLAMQHHSHTFFDSLFRGSQNYLAARELPIPILVFPLR